MLTGFLASLVVTGQSVPTLDVSAPSLFQCECGIAVEYSDAGRAQLEAAIGTLKAALGVPWDLNEENEQAVNIVPVRPEQEDLVVKLAESYFTLGAVFDGGSADEAAAYRKGKHWGLKSLRMDPRFATTERNDGFLAAVRQETRVPELYWASLTWASLANFDRLAAVTSGVVKKTIAMLERGRRARRGLRLLRRLPGPREHLGRAPVGAVRDVPAKPREGADLLLPRRREPGPLRRSLLVPGRSDLHRVPGESARVCGVLPDGKGALGRGGAGAAKHPRRADR